MSSEVRWSLALALAVFALAGAAPAYAADEGEGSARETTTPPRDVASADQDTDTPSLPAVELRAALRLVHRHFDYHDARPDAAGTRPMGFDLPVGPAPFVALALFPFDLAGVKRGVLDVAVIGGYERLIGTQTVALEGTARESRLQTASAQYYGGLRGRFGLGRHELGVRAAYGRHSFSLADLTLASQRGALVPTVDYSFIQLGGDARLRFGNVTLEGYLGTRLVNDTGSLGTDWFPSTHTKALEGELSAAYALTPTVQLALGASYLRYAFDFNPIPLNNPAIAGGATDEYASAWLGVQFAFDAPTATPVTASTTASLPAPSGF